MRKLGQVCSRCCGPSEEELARVTSALSRERDARHQAEKAVSELRLRVAACTAKSENQQKLDKKAYGQLEEQLAEALKRVDELCEEETRLRGCAEAELSRECAKMRNECKDQLNALEQRLGDQLWQEKARVQELLELQGVKKEPKELEVDIIELEEANARLQADLADAQQQEQEVKASMQPLEDKSAQLRKQRDDLSREASAYETDIRAMPALEARVAELSSRIRELEGQPQNTDKLMEDIDVQKEACGMTESMMQRLQSEEQTFSEEVRARQSEAVTLCIDLEAAERQATTLEVSEEILQTKLQGTEETVKGLEQQLDEVNDSIAARMREVSKQQDANARVSLLAATNKEIRVTESVIQQQEAQLVALRGEIDEHMAHIEAQRLKQERQIELRKQRVEEKQRKLEEERARQARIEARQQRLNAQKAAAKAAAKAKVDAYKVKESMAAVAHERARNKELTKNYEAVLSDRRVQLGSKTPPAPSIQKEMRS